MVQLATDANSQIGITEECWRKVGACRKIIDNMVRDTGKVVYGVNTGFGNFANRVI